MHLGLLERLRLPGSPRQLALVRIAFGIHLLIVFTSPVFGAIGAIGLARMDAHTLLPNAVEQLVLRNMSPLLVPAGVVAALLTTVGILTRLALPVLLLCFFLLQGLYFRATQFHDDWLYFNFFLLVLCFSPCADDLSLDAWFARRLRRWRGRPLGAYRWPIELMLAWFCSIYLAAGVAKLFPLRKGLLWFNGRRAQELAMEFLLESPLYWLLGRTPFDYTLQWPFALGAAATVIVELGAVAVFFTHRMHGVIAVSLLLMHVFIYLFGIPGFVQIAMTCMLLFLAPAPTLVAGTAPSAADPA